MTRHQDRTRTQQREDEREIKAMERDFNRSPSAIFLEPDEFLLDTLRQQGLIMTEEELAQRVLNIFENSL